ncbi:hypothetical protein BDV96DRAFT_311821 [Lophiotrema nucula]|uniref:Uncharacterized protein n=1 Tax=Lophiotrema nucula TaxID=690887 RepID=A0A6A5YIC8_9PLEO|nr:hypothetical protein BDV96DRAFT_311821 [Lophiotrema nucula]
MRQCTFTSERHGPYRARRSSSRNYSEPPGAASDQTELPDTAQATSPSQVRIVSPQSQTPAATRSHASVSGEHGLADTMMTTIVSNGNDALNLLFEADQQDEREPHDSGDPVASFLRSFVSPTLSSSEDRLPEISEALSDIWNSYRFVRMGWLSAEEVVWYMDMFFKNMVPLSPVLDYFYANHDNHYVLITQEPLLSSMILAISSRYHSLPTAGGQSRGYIIHQRLWEHCQHLLMRIVLGMEKGSKAKTRTLGSIEALLLLTEWHPRAMHAPPSADGWDADVIFIMKDKRDQNGNVADTISRKRWTEDVIEPARRSDRMSWMVLGIINSLADELGLFDEQSALNVTNVSPYETRLLSRRSCLAKLIGPTPSHCC